MTSPVIAAAPVDDTAAVRVRGACSVVPPWLTVRRVPVGLSELQACTSAAAFTEPLPVT